MRADRALRERACPRLRPGRPAAARARLAEIEPAFEAGFLTPPLRDLLLGLADHSPFLWETIARSPERFAALAVRPPEDANADLVARQRAAAREAGANPDLATVARRLRANRTEHALLVALADLGGCWKLDAVTRALSDFADASVAAAIDAMLMRAMSASRFRPPDPDAPQAGSGLIVLGLGKLGGHELNYSSDVDLVIFFDPERGAAAAGPDAKAFFVKLAQGIAKLLSERTADGYVHRVDYRLRPDPGSTAVAASTAFALDYYQTVGQDWERAAFIKARPITGDVEAGEAFLAELAPFIWRRHLDFAAIAEIHALKRQIHAVRGHEAVAVAGHDVKIGRGGIREIEFFAQTQQLVFGGRDPALRGRRTVDALDGLAGTGRIDARARDELATAYAFLRTVEHRLQMVRDEQTQRLPSEPETLSAFAGFCGFDARAAFEAALLDHARRVEAHYALLFEGGSDATGEPVLAFGIEGPGPDALAALAAFGFRDAARACEIVREWQSGRRPALRGERARRALSAVLPSLLRALGGTADPDAALLTLDRALARMPAAAELLSILRSHERLRLLFADLLGASPRLAETVGFSPHVLDAVLEPDFVAPTGDRAQMLAQYRALVGEPASHEDFLDRCRDATRRLGFVTGARLVSGLVDPRQAGDAYTAVAEAAIGLALEAEERRFVEAHGRVPGGRCCVLALGRLGSRQLTATSDLDLVFLYDFDPVDRMSDGLRPIDAVVGYNRLAQRLHAALTVPTRRGRHYALDLRLRPYGSHGPPAVQLKGFVAYHRDEAEPWEHMALTRARAVAGDSGLAAEATAAVADQIARPRDPASVCAQAGAMRALVARERESSGPHDLKHAPGGLFDLDFLAQAIVLGHGLRDCVGLDGGTVLRRAGERGLIPVDLSVPLRESYEVLDAAHQWQRLMVADPAKPPPAAAARQIARSMGFPDSRALAVELRLRRRTALAALTRIRRRATVPG